MPIGTATGWEESTDDELLRALTRQDLRALLELHCRYAPHFYALARRGHPLDPERQVQDAWLHIMRHAHCHAQGRLDARSWMLVMAYRALTTP